MKRILRVKIGSYAPFSCSTREPNPQASLDKLTSGSIRVLLRNAQYVKSQGNPEEYAQLTALHSGPFNDTHLVFRAMQMWPPGFIIYACPFVVCTLIGPTFDNVRACLLFEPGNHGTYLQMLKLILRNIGTFWELGETGLSKPSYATA